VAIVRLIPGGPFVVETGQAQRLIPGGPAIGETFDINAVYSAWSKSSETPVTTNANEQQAVNLGVRFRVSQSGYIKGIRFWKAADTTGYFSGHLWNAQTGAWIASTANVYPAGSGWVQIDFASSVAVTAGTIYAASIFTEKGEYAFTSAYFSTAGKDDGPLHLLLSGEGGYSNGVFAYGAVQNPTSTYSSGNYWVDVAFTFAPPSVIPRRALTVVAGVIRQVLGSELGLGMKPLVLVDGVKKLRAGSEGVPLVLSGGQLRTLASGETLEI
jgi:hypothetical protein